MKAYRFSDARKLLFREWPRSPQTKDSSLGFEVWEIADNQIETCVLGEMIWFANKSFHGNKKPGVVLHAVQQGVLVNPKDFTKILTEWGHDFWRLESPDPIFKCLGTAVTGKVHLAG